MRRILLSFTSVILGASFPPAASAQTRESDVGPRVPVTIALTERVPGSSRFVVRRLPGATHRDVIMLRPDATAAELTEAVNAMLTARRAEGDVPSVNRTVRVRPQGANRGQRKDFPWGAKVLADVREASPSEVRGLGKVRAIQIWLPRQSQNRAARRKPRA